MKICLLILAFIACTNGQHFYQQQPPLPPYAYQTQYHIQEPQPPAQQQQLAHRDVIENSYRESMLPSEYLNKFYKNPRVADALAKESWFTSQEMPVFDRAAEKIPREMVFKIFKNAGWIKSR